MAQLTVPIIFDHDDLQIMVNKKIAEVKTQFIPKADYENRLKADMVAMLTELQLEIEELKNEPACCQHFVRGVRRSSAVIQQKINSLKENGYGNK